MKYSIEDIKSRHFEDIMRKLGITHGKFSEFFLHTKNYSQKKCSEARITYGDVLNLQTFVDTTWGEGSFITTLAIMNEEAEEAKEMRRLRFHIEDLEKQRQKLQTELNDIMKSASE